jgi:hypothetical protein
VPAEKVEYISLATFHRLIGQRNRIKKLARTLSYYEGYNIHLVCHSNGSAVVLGALRYLDWPVVESLHIFSGVSERDFRKNGMRQAQDSGMLKSTYVYIGGRDVALRLAATWIGWVFRYGRLGLDGPIGHDPDKTTIIRRDDWGHSDWFADINFAWTMRHILHKNQP